MGINPVRNWAKETHITPIKTPLTLEELKQIFRKVPEGIRDIIVLLFVACKRRKEILSLQVENVNFELHYVSYTEFKNRARGAIHKAFYTTPAMENFLRRIIGDRKTGSLWPENFHPTSVSRQFEAAASIIAPKKDATLKNLRQCATDVMEKAGLSDQEIDACLGHISVSKAFSFYADRSPEAVYKRFAEYTRKGITILSESIVEYLE